MRGRRNPGVATHPDLFEGESRVFVPLSDLSEEQIVALPRKAFDDKEWRQLDDDQREAIYESKPDRTVALRLAEYLDEQWKWANDSDSLDVSSETEWFENWLNERVYAGDVMRRVDRGDVDEIVDDAVDRGHGRDHVLGLIKEKLEDQNYWEVEVDDDCRGWTYCHQLRGSLYVDEHIIPGTLQETAEAEAGRQWLMSDVVEAFRIMHDEMDYEAGVGADYLEDQADALLDLLRNEGQYPTIQVDEIDLDSYIVARPNWESISADLTEEWELDEEVVVPPTGEERRVMELKDGFYVADLYPDDLPAEGKKQGICVGQRRYGYSQAVAQGEIKILSLRRPSGKPLLTLEVELDSDGNPVHVEQIKGKGNRLPGWDRGATGKGKMKEHEVDLAIEIVRNLGLSPSDVDDLHPALERRGARMNRNPAGRYVPHKSFSSPPGPAPRRLRARRGWRR